MLFLPQHRALQLNGAVIGGGGLPFADDDAGALDFLHEGVPVGELFGREGVRLDIHKLPLNDSAADEAHVLKPETGELIGYQRHVDIRKCSLLVAGVGPEQNDFPQRKVLAADAFGKGSDPF